VITEEIEMEREDSGFSHAMCKVPGRLRASIAEIAEIFVAASGVLTLVGIVLLIGVMIRAVRWVHPR
jgi:hypothetical protein